jgi:hypothetical protein
LIDKTPHMAAAARIAVTRFMNPPVMIGLTLHII